VLSGETSLQPSAFRIYVQCSESTTPPTLVGDVFHLPYPPTVPSGCPYNLNDADEIGTQQQSGFSWTGTIVTGGTSPSDSFDEEVVTSVDDNVNWTGQEYGFRTSLQTGIIYGYIQDGNHQVNGYSYFNSVPLMQNDGQQHNFKAVESTVQLTNGTYANTVDYYIDGALKGTMTRYSTYDYATQNYHIIITTHRWENGWDSGDSYMNVTNVTVLNP
jgi:hypothetical protein